MEEFTRKFNVAQEKDAEINHNNARTLIRKLDRDELLQTLVRSYLGK